MSVAYAVGTPHHNAILQSYCQFICTETEYTLKQMNVNILILKF